MDQLLFVRPRRNYLRDKDDNIWKEAPDHEQRSLRATTMQGDRIALARSEKLPAGTQLAFQVELLIASAKGSKIRIEPGTIKLAMKYGSTRGFGQWRSGGYGTFDFTIK